MSHKSSGGGSKIRRKSYNRRLASGKVVHVKAGLISATSQSGRKRSLQRSKQMRSISRKQSRASRSTHGPTACPPGRIKRSAYSRKSYRRKSYSRKSGVRVKGSKVGRSVVASSCILDRGRPGKGASKIGPMEKGVLKRFGYSLKKNKKSREKALKRALSKGVKPLPLFRQVNALSVLLRNTEPALASKANADKKFVQRTKEYKNRKSRK